MGPQTILCPEMFSINFWHQWKMGMLCSPPPSRVFGEGTRTSLNLPRYNSGRCLASLPPSPTPSILRPSFSPGYIKEKQAAQRGIGFNCLDHRCMWFPQKCLCRRSASGALRHAENTENEQISVSWQLALAPPQKKNTQVKTGFLTFRQHFSPSHWKRGSSFVLWGFASCKPAEKQRKTAWSFKNMSKLCVLHPYEPQMWWCHS